MGSIAAPLKRSGAAIVEAGGQMSCREADNIEMYRPAAGYVHRIPNGEKSPERPVRTADMSGLAVHLETAKSLGPSVPPTSLERGPEVIE